MDKKSKVSFIFIIVLILIAIGSLVFTYYKTVVREQFEIVNYIP